jgi:hypothetical protein
MEDDKSGTYVATAVNVLKYRRMFTIRFASESWDLSAQLQPFPEFNKFLVHFESALFTYPLDLVISVSQGYSTPKTLEDSAERLAQKDGNVYSSEQPRCQSNPG